MLGGTEGSKSSVSVLRLVVSGNSGKLIFVDGSFALEDGAGNLVGSGSGLELLSSSIVDETLLGLVLTSGEENKLGLVGVKSLGVQLELLFTRVSSSVINGDSNSACEIGVKTSGGELSQSEASSVSNLTSIPLSGRRNDGAELLGGSRESTSGLGNSVLVAFSLLGSLVEVSFCSARPVLAEMDVGNHVVVLDHC